jgi:chromosome segregation ATPase
MLNTDSFTNILDTYTDKIKDLKDDIPATQWISQMTDRVQAMEHENEKSATSLQHYEIGLQKAEHNMQKMNMSASQEISKTTRSEETITALQSEVQQLREQIARLERASHQHSNLHNNIVSPALT